MSKPGSHIMKNLYGPFYGPRDIGRKIQAQNAKQEKRGFISAYYSENTVFDIHA